MPEGLRGGLLSGYEHDYGFPTLAHFDRHFDAMRQNMDRVFREVQSSFGDPASDGHSVVRQSAYSYCRDGDGTPRVFEAHSSTRTAPGGLSETHKAFRDSERQLEKQQVTHHIGSRGRTVNRERNMKTNESNETQRFEGVEQTEEAHNAFDAEWQQLTREANALWGGQPFFAVDRPQMTRSALPASAGAPAAPAAPAAQTPGAQTPDAQQQ